MRQYRVSVIEKQANGAKICVLRSRWMSRDDARDAVKVFKALPRGLYSFDTFSRETESATEFLDGLDRLQAALSV